MNHMFKISICIPTYNRASFLRETLESICRQAEFSAFPDEIEIVISDNCSVDETQVVCAEFVNRYPQQVKYFCNQENIGDRNFENVLRLATGDLRKLNNDTLLFLPGSLSHLLQIYAQESMARTVVFFKNADNLPDSFGVGINSFVRDCSLNCSWIGGFCIWAEHLLAMPDFSRLSRTMLTQVDVIFRLLEKYKSYRLINRALFKSVSVRNKNGYSYVQVFLCNYFKILENFSVDTSLIEKEFKCVMLQHVLRQHAGALVGFGPQHDMRGIYSYLANVFLRHPFLTLFYVVKLFAYVIKFTIAKYRYGVMGK